MELNFDKNTIDYMSQVTRYNISTYLDLYSIFIKENQPKILAYYREQDVEPDSDSFDFMEKMIAESVKIDNLIKIHKNAFDNISHWELLITLEDIRDKFETIQNTSKWIGSSKTKNSWHSTSIQVDRVMQQNETLENISLQTYGENTDSQNDWARIAMENDLLESDYNVEGGTLIGMTKKVATTPNFFLRTVVDSLINESLYGLDICKKITFENDDIKVLSYHETVKQSVQILILLKKGDVPEFPNMGISAKVGASFGQLFYSSIIRQLQAVFETDDTLRNFSVIDLKYYNGDLSIAYSVDTMYNLTIKDSTLIKN